MRHRAPAFVLFAVLSAFPMNAAAACQPQNRFTNSTPIVIPDPKLPGARPTSGRARPYPSTIDVTGVMGQVTKVTVTLHDGRHDRPEDVDILLVGPHGEALIVLSDVVASGFGPTESEGPHTVELTDTPGPGEAQLVRIKPTNVGAGDSFSRPAPPPPYRNPAPAGTATLAETFGGRDPNGTWSLYVMDDGSRSTGSIAGGWTLILEAVCP